MKIVIIIVIILFIANEDTKSQPPDIKSSYVSVNLGGYKTNLGHKMSNRYTASLAMGIGYGYALSVNSFLYSKLTYFTMPKFLAYEENPNSSNAQNEIGDLHQIKVSFSQYIFNLGIQHNFYLFKDYLLGIIGGFSYTLFNQEIRNLEGGEIKKIKNIGLFGYFSGLDIEKNFRDDEVTMFGEIQYNYAIKNIVDYRREFSGINYTVGLRFYLSRSD